MNKHVFLYPGFGLLLFVASSCRKEDPPLADTEKKGIRVLEPMAVEKTNPMKIYAHYMPWFETPATNNGTWGMHWTMATCNPEVTGTDGKRQIASRFYPLIGPYASGDEHLAEYHLLLMKYAGIDGVIIDWYGSFDFNDYDENRRNTEALIALTGKTGMEFSVMYEDRTSNEVVGAGLSDSKIEAAKADMLYIQNKYFNNPSYTHIQAAPLLTVFGPVTIQSAAEWSDIFSVLQQTPLFLTLWGESGDAGLNASGEFAWVWVDNTTLSNFYTSGMSGLDVAMGSAYPGFVDYYEEGGWGSSLGWTIEHNNGATFDQTLTLAQNASLDYLQLATWNDFGEGTMIEPTEEFGYTYLEKLQNFSGAPYTAHELENITRLYTLRKLAEGNTADNDSLTQAFYYFVNLQPEKAIELIGQVGAGY